MKLGRISGKTRWPALALHLAGQALWVGVFAVFIHFTALAESTMGLRLDATIGPVLVTAEPNRQFTLAGPFGVTVAGDNTIFISDDLGHAIYRLGHDHLVQAHLGPTLGLRYTDAILVNATGEYVIADTGNNRLLVVTPKGELVREIRRFGWFRGGLANPRSVALTPEGYLVADWGNNVVRSISPTGELLTTWGKASSKGSAREGEFNGPIDAVRLSSGEVAVSDHRNDRIQILASDGTARILGQSPVASDSLKRPGGLALGPDGHLWVADMGNGAVRRFDPAGRLVTTFRSASGSTSAPSSTVQFARPTDLAFSRDGRLYIADAGHHAVFVVLP